MKCWNCDGLGLIPLENEDDPEEESYAIGDQCPLCQHGKISFKKWLNYHLRNLLNPTNKTR